MTPEAIPYRNDRLNSAIAELGYDAVLQELTFPREEPNAHDQNSVRFLLVLVGVPDNVLVPVRVGLDASSR